MSCEDWDTVLLGDIASISSGGTPSRKKPELWGGEIPWATTSEVDFSTITHTEQKITQLGIEHSSAKVFPAGTLLMAMYGQGKTRGKVATLGIDASTNQACAAIQLNHDCHTGFYFQYLQHRYLYIRGLSNSGGQDNLSGSIIRKIQVVKPPLTEQKQIAEVLSSWDKAITITEQLLANSQQQKKALMQQLLTGKRRLPGFHEEWATHRLGDSFSRVSTKNQGASTNVVTMSAKHGLIRQEEFFKKTVASATLDNYFLLRKGQFAYNKSYSNGYPMGIIKRLNRYSDGVVTTLYICFEASDSENICAEYFEQFFDSGLLNRGLSKVANEGGRAHGLLNVKPGDFFNLSMSIPEHEEQLAIAKVLTTADRETAVIEDKLDSLRLEKKALMQQLLTGNHRVVTGESK